MPAILANLDVPASQEHPDSLLHLAHNRTKSANFARPAHLANPANKDHKANQDSQGSQDNPAKALVWDRPARLDQPAQLDSLDVLVDPDKPDNLDSLAYNSMLCPVQRVRPERQASPVTLAKLDSRVSRAVKALPVHRVQPAILDSQDRPEHLVHKANPVCKAAMHSTARAHPAHR